VSSRSIASLITRLFLAWCAVACASCESDLWTCTNGIQDGRESGPDCGGGLCAPCGFGISCRADSDCASNACVGRLCAVAASCSDRILSGDESDIDCGGSCPPCDPGRRCRRASDCASDSCTDGICNVPTCSDMLLNQDESDVDCGGRCPGCDNGASCHTGSDCASAICSAGICQATLCHDGMKDADESDVDCGGDTCPLCAPGKKCVAPTDCESSLCDGGICQPMPTTCGPGYMMSPQGCVCDLTTCGSCCDAQNSDRCGLSFMDSSNNCGTHGQACFFCDAVNGYNCEHVYGGKDYCALDCAKAPCAGCCTGPQNQFHMYCRFGDDDTACGIGGARCMACADDEHCIANKCVKK
jgi:hypothetical protein